MKVQLGYKLTDEEGNRDWGYTPEGRVDVKEYTKVKFVGQHDKKGITLTFESPEAMVENMLRYQPHEEGTSIANRRELEKDLKHICRDTFCVPCCEIYSVENN